jgi:outer membrane protein TolC
MVTEISILARCSLMSKSIIAGCLAACLAWLPCTQTEAAGQDQARTTPTVPGIGILDAVRSTLQLHPMLQYQQRESDIRQAIKQQRGSDFDMRLEWSAVQSRTNNPLTGSDRLLALQTGIQSDNQAINLTTLSGGAQKLLRSGIIIGPHVELNRTTDNLQIRDGANRSRISFDVTFPLRQGKGRDIVTALESAAQVDVEASLYEVNQTIADLILTTANSYWQYVAALRRLEITAGSESRGKDFLESVQTLIAADRLPRSEINQVRANVASRKEARIAAEQRVIESRNSLGLAMGLDPMKLIELPAPTDSFPDAESTALPSVAIDNIRVRIDQALGNRADYLALQKKVQSAEILYKFKKNSLLPRVDLILTGGYSGLYEGRRPDEFLASPFANGHGPDFTLGLRYSFPPSNTLALGQVAETEAAFRQSVLLSQEKSRLIANDVATTLGAVRSSMERLDGTREAVDSYREALEGERDKLRLGVGSLTDILTIEGRLTDALLNQLSAQLEYSVALVRFRYASGAFVAPDRTSHSVERSAFFTLPPLGIPGK